jgi:high-affinity iron transporter
MFSTLLIAFREFLEAFLIIGMFLGISRQLALKKEKEIYLAAVLGVVVSLLLPILVYMAGARVRTFFTEQQVDLVQGYLMIFSGCFIAYVIFSLHRLFQHQRDRQLAEARQALSGRKFDVSLFFTVLFFIVREGFEVALFTATISLLNVFINNLIGLLLGFVLSALLGALTYLAYIKVPLNKIFKYTEYLILGLGAALVKNGLTKLLENGLHIDLGNILPLHLSFLPSAEDSFLGHALNNLIGLESELSVVKIAVMALYVAIVWQIMNQKHPEAVVDKKS